MTPNTPKKGKGAVEPAGEPKPRRSPNQRPGGTWGGPGAQPKAPITVDLIDPERKAAAQTRAAELGISLGEFVRRAVDVALGRVSGGARRRGA